MTANLVFIGFHGSADRATPESQNELIAGLLAEAGYQVRSGSAQPRQVVRLFDQLRIVVVNLRWADAVVACQFSGRRAWTTYLLTRITRSASIPTVVVLRGGSLPSAAASHPRWIDSTLRLATRLLAPSPYLQRAFEERGHRVSIVPNLVRAPLTAGDHPAPDADAPKILWMRAFHAVYQPELAVEAFAALLPRYPEARLTMAGPDRGLLEATRQRAEQLGVADRIDVPGYLEEATKAEAFRTHDLFLNTPRIDNTPVSVIEAMGAGLPIVATDVGGLRDLARPGVDAVLVPDGDADALADAMDAVLSWPEFAASLRAGGRAIAEQHGATEVRRAWVEVLTEVGAAPTDPPKVGIAPLSVHHVDAIATLHLAAFPDSGLTGLGRRVVRRYYRWQFSGPHPHPVALGTWQDGELIGFMIGGTRREAVAGFVRTSPGVLALGALGHPGFVRRVATSKVRAVVRAIRSNRGRPAPPAGGVAAGTPAGASFGILSIAVAEAHRGTHVATDLLAAAEAEARAAGYDAMNLSVNPDNERAVRFYGRQGWVGSATIPWDGRMTKDLTGS